MMLRRFFAIGCSAATSTVAAHVHMAPEVGSTQKRPTISHKLGVFFALGEKQEIPRSREPKEIRAFASFRASAQ